MAFEAISLQKIKNKKIMQKDITHPKKNLLR
jgi:hypothetical protein